MKVSKNPFLYISLLIFFVLSISSISNGQGFSEGKWQQLKNNKDRTLKKSVSSKSVSSTSSIKNKSKVKSSLGVKGRSGLKVGHTPTGSNTTTGGSNSSSNTGGGGYVPPIGGASDAPIPNPEPISLLLFGTGLLGVGFALRRRLLGGD